MKMTLFLSKCALIVTFAASMVFQANAENAPKKENLTSDGYFLRARALEKQGDAAGAMAAYKEALRINPKNANAEYRMHQLKRNFAKVEADGRKQQFNSVKVSEYKIQGASLHESLVALSTLVEKESKSSVTPNFIIQDPDGKLENAELSLALKNIPAGGVLQYLLEQSGAKARYDEHAIVILPR